jgi:hypothetical protein
MLFFLTILASSIIILPQKVVKSEQSSFLYQTYSYNKGLLYLKKGSFAKSTFYILTAKDDILKNLQRMINGRESSGGELGTSVL